MFAHGSLFAVTHAHFHASMLTEACLTGWPNACVRRGGKLVNAALLSLMRRV